MESVAPDPDTTAPNLETPMRVLFVQDVLGTAYAGDVKEVKSGFARNYLLPQSLAVLATKDQLTRVERLRSAASKRREATETEMTALADKLRNASITITARAGRNDRLYGSITNLMVAEELTKIAGRDIDRRRIHLEPIRHLGKYTVNVKLHPGIEAKVTILVSAPAAVEGAVAEPTAEEVIAALQKGEAIPGIDEPKAEADTEPAEDQEPAKQA